MIYWSTAYAEMVVNVAMTKESEEKSKIVSEKNRKKMRDGIHQTYLIPVYVVYYTCLFWSQYIQ